jgi:hypothetical protein
MFIAALILAWKYTQDRNYSLAAWAKISELCAQEIKTNEAIFLGAVDWRLYIPKTVFERWAKAAELVFQTSLLGQVLPSSMLSRLEEDPDWPCRLSLLKSGRR